MSNLTTSERPTVISPKVLQTTIGVLGIAFPFILFFGVMFLGDCTEIESSISAYYHSIMGNVFVGVLFMVGICLFAYKGYSKKDDRMGDLICLFALAVALFPTSVDPGSGGCIGEIGVDMGWRNTVHLIAASLLFITLAYFSFFLFTKGGKNPTSEKLKRNTIYKTCGCIIIFCILAIGLYFFFIEKKFPALQQLQPVFCLESLALVSFGISWLTKGGKLFKDA